MNKDFININDDPLRELNLGEVSLEKQYTALSEREKILVFCKLNGYTRVPPSAERMYTDPYFLGGEKFYNGGSNLFPFWRESFKEIFPNEVFTAKPFLVLGGGVGKFNTCSH